MSFIYSSIGVRMNQSKPINGLIFDEDKRDSLNLYFKAIFIKIKRVFIIFR
jgi:hypothetical protein